MPCLRHRSLADTPAACSFKTLMICSSVNLLLRIVRLLGGEQNPNLKSGAFQGSRSLRDLRFFQEDANLFPFFGNEPGNLEMIYRIDNRKSSPSASELGN